MNEMNEMIRQGAGRNRVTVSAQGQLRRPRAATPYEAASAKARDAIAHQRAAEDAHGPDSPEARGAEAQTDRAFELWREEQATEREAQEQAERVDFDGGARPPPPPEPPSMGNLIRAEINDKKSRIWRDANDLERIQQRENR